MININNNEKGIALIMVLWVMVLLIAMGTEFALSMKTEVNTTRNFKEDAETYYLAKAGLNLAKAEILSDAQFHSWTEEKGFIFGSVPSEDNESDNQTPSAVEPQAQSEEELEKPEPPQRTELPLGKGFIHYSIRDENGKIKINSATRDILVKALNLIVIWRKTELKE
jgi:general secretion pathway protein K